MKKTVLGLSLGVATIFLTGCPYETKVPLGKPEKVSFKLDGIWEWPSTTSSKDIYKLTTLENSYVKVDVLSGLDSGHTYKAFFNKVSSKTFVSTVEKRENEDVYSMFMFEMKHDTMVLTPISDKKVKKEFNTSAEVRNFLTNNMNKDIFEEPTYLVRRK